MHTLIPALAFRDGQPWLVFGAMGGHTQAQTHLQMLTHLCHDGDDPQAAITAPRWAVDPDHWHVNIEVTRSTTRWSTDCARGATTCDVSPRVRRRHGPRARDRSASMPGYRAATDPRAEGAAAGL